MALSGERVEAVFENERLRVERIKSFGHASPAGFWYDQAEDEWAEVTKGSAVLEFEEGKTALKAGGHCYIKAHRRHRVERASRECEWLCVFVKG